MRLLLAALLLAAPLLARPVERGLSVTATVQRSLRVRTTGSPAPAPPGGAAGGYATAGVLARPAPAEAAAPAGVTAEVLVVLPDGAPVGLRFLRARR